MEQLLLRPAEVAKALSLSRSRAYELIAQGQIPGVVRIGKSVRVSAAALRRYIEALEEGNEPGQGDQQYTVADASSTPSTITPINKSAASGN